MAGYGGDIAAPETQSCWPVLWDMEACVLGSSVWGQVLVVLGFWKSCQVLHNAGLGSGHCLLGKRCPKMPPVPIQEP